MRLIGLVPALRGIDGCHPEYHNAKMRLFNSMDQLNAVGVTEMKFRHVEYCSMLGLARNLLVAVALSEDADITFWVDDDVWFRVEDLCAAIASRLPIVGFPCFHKPENDGQVHFRLNYDIFDNEPIVEVDKDWRHVKMVGTGAMMVRSEVYRAMQRRAPSFTKPDFEAQMQPLVLGPHLYDYFPIGVREHKDKRYYCGEDVGFCYEAGAAGYPVHLYCAGVTAHMRGQFGAICDYRAIREQVRTGAARVSLPYE